MANGDGTITARGKGVWRVQVYVGYDPATKKYSRVTRTVHGTKAEARKVRDQLIQQSESGLDFGGAQTLFSDFASEWCDRMEKSGRYTRTTNDERRAKVQELNKHIGVYKLGQINPKHIADMLLNIKSERGISDTTLLKYYSVAHGVLKEAYDFDFITRNPCDKIKPPKREASERKALSSKEFVELKKKVSEYEESCYQAYAAKEQHLKDTGHANKPRQAVRGLVELSFINAVRLGLATGMRRGEVFALNWSDVSLFDGLVSVNKSLTIHGELKEPKTTAGKRTIRIDQATVKSLLDWKRFQFDAMVSLGILRADEEQPGDFPVFCSNTFTRADLAHFTRWWVAWRKKAGFPDLKFHELRHTHATQLLARGMDVKTTQYRMGHAKSSITLDWYAKPVPENDIAAANIIGELFAMDC